MTIESSSEKYKINPNVVTVIAALIFAGALAFGISYFNSPHFRAANLISQAQREIEDRDYQEAVADLKEAYLLDQRSEDNHTSINEILAALLDKAEGMKTDEERQRIADIVVSFDVHEPVYKATMDRAAEISSRATNRISSRDYVEQAEKFFADGNYEKAAEEYREAFENGAVEEDLMPAYGLNSAYLTLNTLCHKPDRIGVVHYMGSVSFNSVRDKLKEDSSLRLTSDRYLAVREREGIPVVIYGSMSDGRTGDAAAMICADNVNAVYEGEFLRGVPDGLGKLIIWEKDADTEDAIIFKGELKKGLWEGEVECVRDGVLTTTVSFNEASDYSAGVPAFGGSDEMPSDAEFTVIDEETEDKEEDTGDGEEIFPPMDVFDATVWPIENTSFGFMEEGLKPGTLSAGAPARIIAEKGDSFYLHIGDKKGLVKKDACLINLPEVMQEEMLFDIKNAYGSIYRLGGKDIPDITGEALYPYSSLSGGRYLAPLMYPAALRLFEAEQKAVAKGYTLKIYDPYQPSGVTKDIYQAADSMLKEDESLKETITADGGKLTDYVSGDASDHSFGTGVDITLADLGTGEECAMQTAVHEFSPDASAEKNTADADRLKDWMEEAGFAQSDHMWWCFSIKELRKKNASFQIQPFTETLGVGFTPVREQDETKKGDK